MKACALGIAPMVGAVRPLARRGTGTRAEAEAGYS